jgi:hypothetical protein
MSNLAFARPAPLREERAPARRHVEIVTTRAQRKARPKTVYAVVTIASLFVIFAAQLLLSIVVSEGAYQIENLQGEQKGLLRTQDALRENLAVLESTQNLAANAAHFGMVPNSSPLAIDLGTGAVYGLPGSADPAGCGGSCNMITNSLLSGTPLVNPNAAATTGYGVGALTSSTTAVQQPAQQTPALTDALPAPVTR